MKCPDCATRLTEITLEGRLGFRCFKCGGFWLDKQTVGVITAYTLSPWRRIKIGDEWLAQGSGSCPQDGTKLDKYRGEETKPWLVIKNCERCGKLWFGGDALYEYKPEMDQEYVTGVSRSSYTSVLLPIIMIGFLTAGLVIGVSLTQLQNRLFIGAETKIDLVTMTYLGGGKEKISFWSETYVEKVSYRLKESQEWLGQSTWIEDGKYVVELEDLEEGREYVIMISDQKYKFRTE